MEPIKASKIIMLCTNSLEPTWDVMTDIDIDRYNKIQIIRGRVNAANVKVLWSGDDHTDYLVTMFDVCFNFHSRLCLEKLWRAFVTHSKARKADWVYDVPNWEKRLKAPFEYVLRCVLNDEATYQEQLQHAKQSFLLDDVMKLVRERRSLGNVYVTALKPYWIETNVHEVDSYFNQLIYKANELICHESIRRIEGDMIRLEDPQYTLAW